MEIELETARTMLWRAASMLDRKDHRATSSARWRAVLYRYGFEVANQALQRMAATAISRITESRKSCGIFACIRSREGTNEIMRLIVARTLVGNKR